MTVVRLPRGSRLGRGRTSTGAGRTPGFRSKLEERYAGHLELRVRTGELSWFGYEAVRLKLGQGAWFTPDFALLDSGGRFEFIEVKGYRREAAMVRLKVAASTFWWWRFKLVTADGPRAFCVEEVPGGPRPNRR